MSQLTCILFSSQDTLAKTLDEAAHLEVVSQISDVHALGEALRRRHPAVLFVDLGHDPEGVLDEIERLPAPRPLLLFSGPEDDSQVILRAMRLGAREFFSPSPATAQVSNTVERLLLEHPPEIAPDQAPVIAVMGAKGGVGATFVACQLSAELERMGGHTVLTDVNLRLGDVALYCDLQPHFTLANLASEHGDFDAAYLNRILETHSSGMRVLAAPTRAEDAESVNGMHLEHAVSLFRTDYDWVVLDVSRSWDDISVRALDLADQILLVTSMDVPTLNHARQHLDLLQRLGHSAEKIRLIVNRYSKSTPLSKKDVGDFLGRAPNVWIPNDYPTTLACVNEGKSLGELSPRSALGDAYRSLATETSRWCGYDLPVQAAGGLRRLLSGAFLRRSNGAD